MQFNFDHFLSVTLFTMLIFIGSVNALAQQKTEATLVVELNSHEGREMLSRSRINQFVDWSVHFECQENLTFCGVASGAIALNLAGLQAPESERHSGYKLWTQGNFLNSDTEQIMKESDIRQSGMSLSQFSGLMSQNGLRDVMTEHASSMNLKQFRDKLVGSMEDGKFVVLNYGRKELGQDGGGHFSPTAAYDAESDRFLILDVARYRYAPVWASAQSLFESCKSVDLSTGKSRGFVIFQSLKSSD